MIPPLAHKLNSSPLYEKSGSFRSSGLHPFNIYHELGDAAVA